MTTPTSEPADSVPPPLPVAASPSLVDRLLKRPHDLLDDLDRRPAATAAALAALAAACAAAYGLVAGSFSGGPQFWVVPVKAIMAGGLSGLICLPSLHILTCLQGGRQSFAQSAGALLLGVALTGLLLVGFVPVAWIFSQSTASAAFMGFLLLLFLAFALFFGLRLVQRSLARLNGERAPVFGLWAAVFLVVCAQMCTTLRPMVGPFDGFELQAKRFFVDHWIHAGRR